MLLRDLADVKRLFASLTGSFNGLGMTAYSRIIPSYFLPQYHIIALRKTDDLPMLRKKAAILCLEEELGSFIEEEGFNSARLLSHPIVQDHLLGKAGPKYFFLYQSYTESEKLAREKGWIFLANSASLRMRVGERAFFSEMIGRLGLPRIPGARYPVEALYSKEYGFWAGSLGGKFVVQLNDIQQGGGRGTFFVHSQEEYRDLQDLLKREGGWRGIKIRQISIHKFEEGQPASLALCVTKHGILLSALQRQLIDLPYCQGIPENGVFCGHSWGEDLWPPNIKEEARGQAASIGGYLSKLGYRGILGIDFIVAKDGQTLYPLECNPRMTGAFPMLSLLHLGQKIIPMEVFHLLEFLDVPYEIELHELNSQYRKGVKGSHLILFRLHHEVHGGQRPLAAGLYEFNPDKKEASFIGEATEYKEIRNVRQFIIIDGPTDTGGGPAKIQDPFHRFCHILFPTPIINHEQTLSLHTLFVVDWVYGKLFPASIVSQK